jgi:hypothetical protein
MRRIEAILAQRVAFVASRRQHWIQPQLILIVNVFAAKSQPEDALRQHLLHGVANKYLLPVVCKALGQGLGQPRMALR